MYNNWFYRKYVVTKIVTHTSHGKIWSDNCRQRTCKNEYSTIF